MKLIFLILQDKVGMQENDLFHQQKKLTETQIFKEESECCNNKTIKKKLLEKGYLKYNCNFCKINNWNNKEIVLELNHINGINTDNRIENLELLCPNCHSQTNNFRGRNINKSASSELRKKRYEDFIKNPIEFVERHKKVIEHTKKCKICENFISDINTYCSYKCKNVDQSSHIPTKEELICTFKNKRNFSQVSKYYSVSDNAIRKWCVKYNILEEMKKLR